MTPHQRSTTYATIESTAPTDDVVTIVVAIVISHVLSCVTGGGLTGVLVSKLSRLRLVRSISFHIGRSPVLWQWAGSAASEIIVWQMSATKGNGKADMLPAAAA